MKAIVRYSLIPLCLALAACEPSGGDMLSAVKANPRIKGSLALVAMGNSPGGNLNEKLDKLLDTATLEKSSCVAAQDSPGHVCDFRIGFKQPDGSMAYGAPLKGRFFKTGDGWSVELPR